MDRHGGASLGFTIVELIIAITVIGVLATITIVSYNGVTASAGETAIKSNIDKAVDQLEYYRIHSSNDTYPSDANDIDIDDDITVQYTYTSETNSYCISLSNTYVDFYTSDTENGKPVEGVCTGHTAYN